MMIKKIFAVLLFVSVHAAHAGLKPNVVVIFTDDWGYGDLGAFGALDDIKTPNLDRLAKEGVLFSDGYVTAPQCGPSRAGLLTGRHQQRFGFDSITSGPLPLEETTIADRLKKAGYATGMVGKWHQEPNWTNVQWARKLHPELVKDGKVPKIPWEINLRYFPEARGFDHFYCGEWHRYWHNYELGSGAPLLSPVWTDSKEFRVDVQTKAGLAFIHDNADRPFFLYLAYFAPHVPLESPEKYLKRFPGEMPERRRTALAMMSAVDDGVGRIMDLLEEKGLRKNTLVFFTSDNGAPLGAQQGIPMDDVLPVGKAGPAWDGSRNDPLCGEKGMLTEGGVRVPFIASWPGQLPQGKVSNMPVSTLDIAVTANALAGLPHDPLFDGVDLMPFLAGEAAAPQRDLYWKFWNQAAIRSGDWKLIQSGPSISMLFNLRTDKEETRNLIAQHPEVAQKLKGKLGEWALQMQPSVFPPGKMNGQEVGWYQYFFNKQEGIKR